MTPSGRKRLWFAVQVAFVAAALWYAARALGGQWDAFRQRVAELSPAWSLALASATLVLVAYALLIETWQVMLRAWGGALPYHEAARIWFVSNLGKYVPGKIWQIAAMSVMAKEQGVSALAATGSSLVVNLANVCSGLLIVLATGVWIPGVSAGPGLMRGTMMAAALLVGLAALEAVLPRAAALAARLTGRPVEVPRIPARALWAAVIGTAVAWVLYGLAFRLLAEAIGAGAGGAVPSYVAVYAASYLVGYLTPLAPGGIVVREAVLVQGMVRLGLAGEANAWLLALASRLWLTILEVAPGVGFIAYGATRRRPANIQPGS